MSYNIGRNAVIDQWISTLKGEEGRKEKRSIFITNYLIGGLKICWSNKPDCVVGQSWTPDTVRRCLGNSAYQALVPVLACNELTEQTNKTNKLSSQWNSFGLFFGCLILPYVHSVRDGKNNTIGLEMQQVQGHCCSGRGINNSDCHVIPVGTFTECVKEM